MSAKSDNARLNEGPVLRHLRGNVQLDHGREVQTDPRLSYSLPGKAAAQAAADHGCLGVPSGRGRLQPCVSHRSVVGNGIPVSELAYPSTAN